MFYFPTDADMQVLNNSCKSEQGYAFQVMNAALSSDETEYYIFYLSLNFLSLHLCH